MKNLLQNSSKGLEQLPDRVKTRTGNSEQTGNAESLCK